MTLISTSLDFTSRDFDAVKARFERAILSVFPKWSDRSVANFGNIILESVAWIGDVKAFYQDAQAREAFIVTAVQLRNMLRHARRNSYVPRGPSAATATEQFTLSLPAVQDVIVPAGSLLRSKSALNPSRWQTLTALTIVAATQTGSVSVENSENKTEIFTSTERADFEIVTEFTPFLEIVSIVDATGPWLLPPVDNFLDSTATDKHVRLFRDDENRGLIRFGDDNQGKISVGDVTIVYKIGGGALITEANTIEIPEFTLTDILGDPVSFTATNPGPSIGGTNREAIDEIRINAPASIRVNERSVTQDDFSINARRVAGVARALILTSDDLASVAENFGELAIVAEGPKTSSGKFKSAAPTQALLDAVRSKIDNEFPPTITFDYNVSGALLKGIDVTARVFRAEGFSGASVDKNIRDAIDDFLAVSESNKTPNPNVGFGFEFRDADGTPDPFLAWSDIFNAVRDATGVRKVDRSSFLPLDDVPLTLNEFPVVGVLTLLDAETGLPLV